MLNSCRQEGFAMQIVDTESAAQSKLRSSSTTAAAASWSRIARVGSLLPISSHVFRPHWDISEFLLLRWSHHQGRQEGTKCSKPYHWLSWYHLILNYMRWTNLTGPEDINMVPRKRSKLMMTSSQGNIKEGTNARHGRTWYKMTWK